ncbi:MAG: DAK2 domain-containing protein [Coprobacillus sp.]|nr:DAK2 domain-containing protein [Coprobacillus sp.]
MKTINGQTLKLMFISGANNLYNHYPEIDALNVFPVPDGDTGMNMNLTLSSGIKEIQNRNDTSCSAIMKAFSNGLFNGARGNSGVITSQIFIGFARGVGDKEELTLSDFLEALQAGVANAYHVVNNPVEGTILTVVRESTQKLADEFNESMSFKKAMDILISEAKASLDRTPDLLPILKQVGVVDSGSAGLVRIFEGMRSALSDKVIERDDEATINNLMSHTQKAQIKIEEEEFGYCTEFILKLGPKEVKKDYSSSRFKNFLEAHGNSIVYAENEDQVKVHIHTLTPGVVLNNAQQYGEFLKIKVDNMTEQHHTIHEDYGEDIEESAASDSSETPESSDNAIAPITKKYALIAVSSGDGLSEYFKECGVEYIVSGGQTMNPSTDDFVKVINQSGAETVFILPNNSNIFMAAQQAADVSDSRITVYVVPTRTIPQGISSAFAFDESLDPGDNFNNMKDALNSIRSGEITHSIRDSEMDGINIKKDDIIALTNKKCVYSGPSKVEAIKALAKELIGDDSGIVTIYQGEDVTSGELEELSTVIKGEFKSAYPDIEFDVVEGGQPVYSFLVGVE